MDMSDLDLYYLSSNIVDQDTDFESSPPRHSKKWKKKSDNFVSKQKKWQDSATTDDVGNDITGTDDKRNPYMMQVQLFNASGDSSGSITGVDIQDQKDLLNLKFAFKNAEKDKDNIKINPH